MTWRSGGYKKKRRRRRREGGTKEGKVGGQDKVEKYESKAGVLKEDVKEIGGQRSKKVQAFGLLHNPLFQKPY